MLTPVREIGANRNGERKSGWIARILRWLAALALVPLFLVVTQDIQIFPWAVNSLVGSPAVRLASISPLLEDFMIATKDGEQINVWRMPPAEQGPRRDYVAIVFRGNGGPLHGFFIFQQWFASLGITSYLFDYRGYGLSSGWPSERGIYRDSSAVYNFVMERERIQPRQLILLGYSIGTAPAAYLAQKFDPRALLLLAPFPNVPAVLRNNRVLNILSPFLWWKLPTKSFVESLVDTCLIVAHGERDHIIPIELGREVFASYRGSGNKSFVRSDEGGHNDIFYRTEDKLKNQLELCLKE